MTSKVITSNIGETKRYSVCDKYHCTRHHMSPPQLPLLPLLPLLLLVPLLSLSPLLPLSPLMKVEMWNANQRKVSGGF
jgi:hypothetical protein